MTQQTTRQLYRTIYYSGQKIPSRNWCDTTDSYLRFISTVGQTTVPFFPVIIFSGGLKNIAGQSTAPFFPVVIFSGCNWCSYFDLNTNYCTYDRKKLLLEIKVQLSGRLCFLAGSNNNQKKLRPEKKGTVVWPTVEINLR